MTIEENLRVWGESYGWPEDGDEWSAFAEHDREPYESWKQSLVESFILPNLTATSVALEIGCGHGRWSAVMNRKTSRLILVDLTQACLDYTKARLDNPENVYIRTHGPMPEVPSGSVDFVWSFDVCVHIEKPDLLTYAKEISRILAPGGKAILHTADNSDHGGWRSRVTAECVRELCDQSDLRVISQTDCWGDRHQYSVKKHRDVISTIISRRPRSIGRANISVWTFEFGEQPYFKLTDEINREYCCRHGYAFEVYRPERLPDDRHPNWVKVMAVRHALEAQQEGFILFLDRDAYFHDMHRRIEELATRMSGESHYLFGTDHRDRDFAWHDDELNCGVFLIRCTDEARRIARDWWEVPRERPDTLHGWPLEQQAMICLRSREPARIQLIPYFHIGGTDGDFIRHAVGTDKMEFLTAAFSRFKAKPGIGMAASRTS